MGFGGLFIRERDFFMKVMQLKAPGKVNLRLDIIKKRPDGYHDLRALNSAVSIYDEIELKTMERGVEVYCENDDKVPSGEKNIVFQASKEILAYSNKNVGVKIYIKKNIPSGAGMGGGSSNAATVINGLNQLLKINLPQKKLLDIGLRFGADIPFFLNGAPAIATGVGEKIQEVKKMPKLPLVIVWPNIHVSTKKVFQTYRQYDQKRANLSEDLPEIFSSKKTVVKYMHNDLETVTPRKLPVIDEVKKLLVENGALGAQMTGSGPSVFGVFNDKDEAQKAHDVIQAKAKPGWRVFCAESI